MGQRGKWGRGGNRAEGEMGKRGKWGRGGNGEEGEMGEGEMGKGHNFLCL